MLSLAEYVAATADLIAIGAKYEGIILDGVQGETSKLKAVAFVRSLVPEYQKEYRQLLDETLTDAARTAVNHYANNLGLDLDEEQLSKEIVQQQYTDKFYGASLNQRLRINQGVLTRRIVQTASAAYALPKDPKPELLATIFTKPVPFGAQVPVDRRVMQGTLAKIENDVARRMAELAKVRLIRWTLSHRHTKPDICDDLAKSVNPSAVRYMKEAGIRENPRGLFLAEELPEPPHPNCQCEYSMVIAGKTIQVGRVKRTLSKIRSLLSRLRKR